MHQAQLGVVEPRVDARTARDVAPAVEEVANLQKVCIHDDSTDEIAVYARDVVPADVVRDVVPTTTVRDGVPTVHSSHIDAQTHHSHDPAAHHELVQHAKELANSAHKRGEISDSGNGMNIHSDVSGVTLPSNEQEIRPESKRLRCDGITGYGAPVLSDNIELDDAALHPNASRPTILTDRQSPAHPPFITDGTLGQYMRKSAATLGRAPTRGRAATLGRAAKRRCKMTDGNMFPEHVRNFRKVVADDAQHCPSVAINSAQMKRKSVFCVVHNWLRMFPVNIPIELRRPT